MSSTHLVHVMDGWHGIDIIELFRVQDHLQPIQARFGFYEHQIRYYSQTNTCSYMIDHISASFMLNR
jgi:hypothetical protein